MRWTGRGRRRLERPSICGGELLMADCGGDVMVMFVLCREKVSHKHQKVCLETDRKVCYLFHYSLVSFHSSFVIHFFISLFPSLVVYLSFLFHFLAFCVRFLLVLFCFLSFITEFYILDYFIYLLLN